MNANDFNLMASLLEEAAKNLREMNEAEAERLQVRHFLPDELDGSAIMLREHAVKTNAGTTLFSDTERAAFEMKCWAYYQNLKANGWSSPEEGDTTDPSAMFWRLPTGQYGVRQIEAAWWGWKMAKGLA